MITVFRPVYFSGLSRVFPLCMSGGTIREREKIKKIYIYKNIKSRILIKRDDP